MMELPIICARAVIQNNDKDVFISHTRDKQKDALSADFNSVSYCKMTIKRRNIKKTDIHIYVSI